MFGCMVKLNYENIGYSVVKDIVSKFLDGWSKEDISNELSVNPIIVDCITFGEYYSHRISDKSIDAMVAINNSKLVMLKDEDKDLVLNVTDWFLYGGTVKDIVKYTGVNLNTVKNILSCTDRKYNRYLPNRTISTIRKYKGSINKFGGVGRLSLNPGDKLLIQKMLNDGYSKLEVARKFNVRISYINMIRKEYKKIVICVD